MLLPSRLFASPETKPQTMLLRPCPRVADDKGRSITATIFSPASFTSSSADTISSPRSHVSVTSPPPAANHLKNTIHVHQPRYQSMDSSESSSSSTFSGNADTKTYRHSSAVSRDVTAQKQPPANPPHLPSFDTLLNFLYTSDTEPLVQILSSNPESVFGILGNIMFLGMHGVEQYLYQVVADALLSTDNLESKVFTSEQWNTSIVPSLFIKNLTQKGIECGKISQFQVLKMVLLWKRPRENDISADSLEDLFSEYQIDFNHIPRALALKFLEKLVDEKKIRESDFTLIIQKLFEPVPSKQNLKQSKTLKIRNFFTRFLKMMKENKRNDSFELDNI